MRVKALSDGTIGRGNDVRRVRKGQVFDLPEGFKLGRWMIPLAEVVAEVVVEEPKGKSKKPQKAASPETFSEMTPLIGADLV